MNFFSALRSAVLLASAAGILTPIAGISDTLIEGWISNNVASSSQPLAQRKSFQLRLRGDQWLARISGPFGQNQFFEVSGDAKSSIYLNNMDALVKEQSSSGLKVGSNLANVIMRADPVPHFSQIQEAGLLWLTYCSESFFDEQNNETGFITPPCFTGILNYGDISTEDLLTQKYHRGRINVGSGASERVDFLYDARHYSRRRSSITLKESIARYRNETNATFRVIAWAKGPIEVPKESELVVYPASGSGRTFRVVFYLCTTNVAREPSESSVALTPTLPGFSHFTDLRFISPDQPSLMISYDGTNWLSEAQVRKLPAFRIARAQLGGRPLNRLGTILVAAGLTVLFAFPACVARLRERKGAITKQKKGQ